MVLQSTWTVLYGNITMEKEIMDMTELLHTYSPDCILQPGFFALLNGRKHVIIGLPMLSTCDFKGEEL